MSEMKRFTQAEFDAFPVVAGRKQCPSGDYSAIQHFPKGCNFEAGCKFAAGSSFGTGCNFEAGCKFAAECSIGAWCNFEAGCKFAAGCNFGDGCSFEAGCKFAAECSIGAECSFEAGCSFEGGHKAKAGYPLLAIVGAGFFNRTTYFFNTEDGIIVRAGCFKGSLQEFRAKVRADDPNGGIKALQYLGFANIVAATWAPELIEA